MRMSVDSDLPGRDGLGAVTVSMPHASEGPNGNLKAYLRIVIINSRNHEYAFAAKANS